MSDPTAARNQYALAALKERRASLSGDLAQLESQARLKREALAHLDAVLRMFAPEVDPEAIPARRARKGSSYPIDNLSRRIMGVLRRRGEPMPCGEVVEAITAEMGFPEDAVGVVSDRVRYGLRNMANGKGPVMKSGSRGDALWGVRFDEAQI